MSRLPAIVAAVDVETTGLYSDDRVVTLGAWRVNTAELGGNALHPECLHIIADPGRKSHPRAEEVHGYSDWTLRHQQPFSEHAQIDGSFSLEQKLLLHITQVSTWNSLIVSIAS